MGHFSDQCTLRFSCFPGFQSVAVLHLCGCPCARAPPSLPPSLALSLSLSLSFSLSLSLPLSCLYYARMHVDMKPFSQQVQFKGSTDVPWLKIFGPDGICHPHSRRGRTPLPSDQQLADFLPAGPQQGHRAVNQTNQNIYQNQICHRIARLFRLKFTVI